MDFPKFVSVLDKSALFFCNASRLGDPFEGTWPTANFETLAARYSPEMAGIARIGLQGSAHLRGQFSVNCWHWNGFESDAMWGLYATRNAGIAIQTVFKSFAESLTDEIAITIGVVKYVDYQTDAIPDDHIVHTHWCTGASTGLSSMNIEVRAILPEPSTASSDLQVGQPMPHRPTCRA